MQFGCRFILLLLVAGCTAGRFPAAWPYPAGPLPVTGTRGMVVSTDSIA
jgi:hypothetical protein